MQTFTTEEILASALQSRLTGARRLTESFKGVHGVVTGDCPVKGMALVVGDNFYARAIKKERRRDHN